MPAADPVSSRPLILVVDDSHVSRLAMLRCLTGGGYDVLTAPDGGNAIGLLQSLRIPPDLVITDVRMPGIHGVRLAAWLAERFPQLPVMFVSGFPAEEKLSGPRLTKPITPAELAAAVHQMLEQARVGA